MKIEGNQPPERTEVQDARTQKVDKKQATEESTSPTGKQAGTTDKVNLSDQAKEISRLKALMNQLPEVREEEVDAVKKSIETNSYNVDSLKVAEKILKEI